MNISVQHLGKRYNREWIFRNIDHVFEQGKSYAVTGSNGSGKSTLLQVLAGAVMHSEGKIDYSGQMTDDKLVVNSEKSYRQISIAAPYLDLIEEMTASEFLVFHAGFKALISPDKEILAAVGLEQAADKQIRYFSSGMKQRLKLAQAFFSDTSVLLLDEPLTNLDENGIAVYRELRSGHTKNRLVIISSNDPQEYENCHEVIRMGDYK